MRKIQLNAMFFTILLAIPFIALAVFATAYLTLNLLDIVAGLIKFLNETTYIGRPFLVEFFGRLPELIGMGAGMLVMLAMLILFRPAKSENG